MHIKMRFCIVYLASFALAAAIPTSSQYYTAKQDLNRKQQDVNFLLENILSDLPNNYLREVGTKYQLESYIQNYANPSTVQYFAALVGMGNAQPKNTPFSFSIGQLRKENALLTQILLGAQNYETFINTAAWARVHLNEEQFVTAFSSAVLQRSDMSGIILPPVYEVFPHYFFDSNIIHRVQNYINKNAYVFHGESGKNNAYNIYVNLTSGHYEENRIAYFTEDVGLNSYYSYVQLASYMHPQTQQSAYNQGNDGIVNSQLGYGSNYYYIHQQLLARYNLERIGQSLPPVKELDSYYEHIEAPFTPKLCYPNSVQLPARDENIYITPRHHNYKLSELVHRLEERITSAINSGYVLTAQNVLTSLYQPQGLNILGEVIEGTVKSINPRFFGSLVNAARQLLGNAPEFNNIWEYTPSALELGQTAVRDPIFYQLYNRILKLFRSYQDALPSYQYNDVALPGVYIQRVDVDDLVTYFSDYEVDLSNAVRQPVREQQDHQSFSTAKAHLKRLDHKQYVYSIHVQATRAISGAVVRVFIGPKYNYDGQSININEHRNFFYEIDQFAHDLSVGQNVIVRNSQQATGQSFDWPTIQELKYRVQNVFHSQFSDKFNYPQQLYGFPARLRLPMGSKTGFPLQLFVVISSGAQKQAENYGPIVNDDWMTYEPQHYQIISQQEYQQYTKNPIDLVTGGYRSVEVIPEVEGNWHWGYLYNKYPVSYLYSKSQSQLNNADNSDNIDNIMKGDNPSSNFGAPHNTDNAHGGAFGTKPYVYHQVVQNPANGGKLRQTIYRQGMYHSVRQHGYPSRGIYGDINGVPASSTHQSNNANDEYIYNYYQNKHISDVIGGVLSLDGRPLGFPLDRQLSPSAFLARNIYVKDVLVYHENESQS